VLFSGKRFTVNSMNPYKIRNTTMKNLIENASKNSQKMPVNNPMLNWASEGVGGSM
jgi:hypothetical protein